VNTNDTPVEISEISEQRFNAFVVWARGAGPLAPTKEVAWLEIRPAKVLGVLFVDLTDRELHSCVLAPDLSGRYRGVRLLGPHADVRAAVNATAEAMANVHADYDNSRTQGDERPSENFFRVASNEDRLHVRFKYLRDQTSAVAARRLIEVAMRWYENQDGTFVEQFQTTAFDARVWELYVWALMREAGLRVEQPKPAPDFLARGVFGDFYVEATTANPPPVHNVPVPPETADELFDYAHNYLPTRFSGPLVAKLRKRYWERTGARKIPFVIAVQDFHQDLSMTWSQPALYEYLYGVRIEDVERDGVVRQVEVPVGTLKWGTKELESGFFKLPDSERISAVIFNAAGTLSKFNRMGIAAGMGESSLLAFHRGSRYAEDNSGEVVPFSQQVGEGYEERWIDGTTVFHNPGALYPLPPEALPGAAHVSERAGMREQSSPAGHLVTSTTSLVLPQG
jgi:hypothetical protein